VALARAISLLGSNLTVFALVLREKDQGAAIVATLFALGTLPLILLAPWAGLLADRYSTRTLIPAASVIQAALVATLVIDTPLPVVFATAFLVNACAAVVAPAWAAVVPTLTTSEDLPRAMGLNQSLFALAGLLAPAVGGFLVASTGYTWPFIIDAVSFLAVAAAPFVARVNRPRQPHEAGRGSGAFDGIRFLFDDPLLRAIVILLTVFIVALGVINVGEVYLITDVLGGSAVVYGLAGTLFAAGMLLGGVATTARRVGQEHFAAMVVLSLVIMGVAALGISLSWHWGMVLVLGFVMGLGNAILQAYASTVILTRSPDELRGRVMAGVGGVINIGSMVALGIGGVAIGLFDVRPTLIAGAAMSLVMLAVFAPAVLRAGRAEASVGEREPA
jgi:MFS family permease